MHIKSTHVAAMYVFRGSTHAALMHVLVYVPVSGTAHSSTQVSPCFLRARVSARAAARAAAGLTLVQKLLLCSSVLHLTLRKHSHGQSTMHQGAPQQRPRSSSREPLLSCKRRPAALIQNGEPKHGGVAFKLACAFASPRASQTQYREWTNVATVSVASRVSVLVFLT
eukprot:IDg13455t1